MKNTTLKLEGAIWVNLDAAESNINRFIQHELDTAGISLTPIEASIMLKLLGSDGIKASDLARAVGRAATSFTPNLDKLQKKGFLERRADVNGDRRAVNLHLTAKARECEQHIRKAMQNADEKIFRQTGLTADQWEAGLKFIAALQTVEIV